INLVCNVPGPVANDRCADAIVATEGSVAGTTIGATNDGTASCGQAADSPDVWYTFTSDRDCIARVSLCPPAYDTVLSLHNGCPGTSGNQIACNDDSCELGSRVATRMSPGQTVYVRVSGFSGATGDFTLQIVCEEPPPPGEGADVFLGE